jgi:hypothetical protein
MLALALRVLLCVSLVLGGANSAAAAVQVHLAHVQALPPAPTVDGGHPEPGAPCHVTPSPGDAPGVSSASSTSSDGGSGPHDIGCCEPGQCSGTCVQSTQAALPGHRSDRAAMRDVVRKRELEPAHAAPDPRRPIRPPIA